MLFNSIEFLIFLPIVFIAYWFIFQKNLKAQNLLLLFSSYVFYGWWDWRFLSLIFLSTIVDYFSGLNIYNSTDHSRRKFFLWISIIFNISLLGFFKYFNFFIDSWIDLFGVFGYKYVNDWTLNVILPVGISFYTFQTMSYSLDIYYNKLKPTNDFISFASFVSFFPQLVAGPIERASNLLPQILNSRKFKYEEGVDGLRLILWGMFKKVFIADSLAPFVNDIFSNYTSYDGGVLVLGLIYFSFQIYCDFSGYSDIAIGTAKLFGISLMSNFKFPYFSRDISEFWRRWHISLSSWFKDYVYIPLGGSKTDKISSIRNIFIIFIVSGFWHGAKWTFILWGLLHALFYVPSFLSGKNREYAKEIVGIHNILPSLKEIILMIKTYLVVTISWVFFRSETILDAFKYLKILVFDLSFPNTFRFGVVYIIILLFYEWLIKNDERKPINIKNYPMRKLVYLIMVYCVISSYNIIDKSQFIYFQF